MSNRIVKDIQTQFNKKEIIKVAKELGIEAGDDDQAVDVINVILNDLYENGVPDEWTTLFGSFLYAAEIINDQGEIIQESDDEVKTEEIKYPQCFGYADKRDPSCRKCKVLDLCIKERIRTRPSCFGLLYDERADECKLCIEAMNCKTKLESMKGSI